MSQTKLPSGQTATLIEGEEGERHQRFKGVRRMVRIEPGNWVLPETYLHFADNYYNFKFYPDDVAVMGFPKSGTTWMQEILWTLMNNPNLDNPAMKEPLYGRSLFIEGDINIKQDHVKQIRERIMPQKGVIPPVIENAKDGGKDLSADGNQQDLPISAFQSHEGIVLSMLKMSPRPRTFKTHTPFPMHNPKFLDTVKVVYIVRNPKDLLVSYYHNAKIMTVWDYTGSFDDVIDVLLNDECFYGPYWNHMREAFSHKGHPNLHIVHYERLKKDPLGSLTSLNSFLGTGCTEDQLRKICDYISFDTMKKRNNPFPINIFKEDVTKKEGGFFRKGQVGDWKNKFTPEQEAKVDAWIEKNIKDIDIDMEYT